MIQIRSFYKGNLYQDFHVEFKSGLNYLKGKNGSGKTTLLDCIAGLDKDYKGEIINNNNLVYLNQNLYFSRRLKVKDLVQFMLRLDNIKDYKNYYSHKNKEYRDYFNLETIWEKKLSY